MSKTTLYFADPVDNKRQATFVCSDGHVLLNHVPEERREEVMGQWRVFRDSLDDSDNITRAQAEDFLRENGYKERPDISPPLKIWEIPAEPVANDGAGIDEMGVKELKELAKELEIDGYSGMKKAELVEAVKAKQAELAAAAPQTDEEEEEADPETPKETNEE